MVAAVCGLENKALAETADTFEAAGDIVIRIDQETALNPAAVRERAGKTGRIDLLLYAPTEHLQGDGGAGRHDYDGMAGVIERNVSAFRVLVEELSPFMKESPVKRICVLTSRESSIRENDRKADYAFYMSLAAVSMAEKIFFNRLRPEGFTFRCFAAEVEKTGFTPAQYFKMNTCYDPKEPYTHSDENRLVLRNGKFEEIAW